MTLRLLFAGTPEAAVPSLRAFAADSRFEVAAALTRPDAPTGRGRKLTPSPVKAAALDLSIPVIESKPRDAGFLDDLSALHVDIAAVIAYGNILPKSALDAVPLGWFNLHFSNLPKWRGAAPVQRAIWAGDATAGADVFKVGEGLDDGPVIASISVKLSGRETSGELLELLATQGAPMYVDALAAVGEGTVIYTPQAQSGIEYAHKITVEDAHIDVTAPAEAVDRQIRACTPNPGAWVELHATGFTSEVAEASEAITLHVLRAQPANPNQPNVPRELKPGQIVTGKKNVWIGTATAPLELLEVKAQGKKAMRAADWARGARLGETAYLR